MMQLYDCVCLQSLLCGGHSWFLCDSSSPTSPSGSSIDSSDTRANPSTYVILQTWQLLCMALPLFLPKQNVMWLLKAHLGRHADPK